MPTVKPLDTEALLEAAHRTRGIVTAEEHSIIGGLGEAVAGFISESHPMPVRRVGVRDIFGESGTCRELFDLHGLRARNIVENALVILEGNGKMAPG
jgi:transketolase